MKNEMKNKINTNRKICFVRFLIIKIIIQLFFFSYQYLLILSNIRKNTDVCNIFNFLKVKLTKKQTNFLVSVFK